MKITIPIRIESTPNLREHWAARAKRTREQRAQTHYAMVGAKMPRTLPCTVTLTRIAPRTLDDDNHVAGCKGVRDAIAFLLGADDADPRITWRYGQAKGAPKQYALQVELA